MATSWKVTALASRRIVEAALAAHEAAQDWDPTIVVAGSEVAENQPEDWRFEAWLPREPNAWDITALLALFPAPAPPFRSEALEARDWVAESQAGLAPIRAGRFRVRTPEHPAEAEAGLCELVIPAAQAFGTGQHATTAGCLEMLTAIANEGVSVTRFADIGTGTGLLAFAARDLWPQALGIASDIDPVCAGVLEENAALNGVPLGTGAGELTFVVAAGLDHPELRARAPYDLIVANILAGPLIELAADLAGVLAGGGELVLAGQLASQQTAVRQPYEQAGLVLVDMLVRGDWAILRMRRA
jgi:ribosomal protein L11 methyltransferase